MKKSENISEFTNYNSAIDYLYYFSVIWRSKKKIIYFCSSVIAITVVIALLLPKSYQATVTLLPGTDQTKLSGIGSLASLANLAGVAVGQGPIEQLYPRIIKSEAVLKEVIYATYTTQNSSTPLNLIDYWEIKMDSALRSYEVALKRLQDELIVEVDRKTNIVTISLLMGEPQLAADVTNKVAIELDKFLRTKRITNASEQRKWIESRLSEVRTSLRLSEDRLKIFREKNRSVANSPQLLMEQERLAREIEINNALYIELTKQFEIAKIEEVKNIPVITIMDAARALAHREKPKRTLIVLVMAIIAAMVSIAYVIIIDKYRSSIVNLRDKMIDIIRH